MSDTNGNGSIPTVSQLREQVRRERLQTRLAEARHDRQVLESFGQLNFGLGWGDLLNPYAHRRDGFGNVWLPLGQTGVGARRDGRDLPFIFTDTDLDQQRALARWLTKKNDLAIGALSTLRNYAIKQGYKWEAKPAKGYEEDERVVKLAEQVQRVIDLDADLNKLPQREREAFWCACRDGDVFVRHFKQDDGTTRHRFVYAEQVRDPGTEGLESTFGIETDGIDGETPLGYWTTYDGTSYDRVLPDEMSHLKRNVDMVIKRGVSDFYSAGETFDEVQKLLQGMRRGGALLSKIAWIEQFKNTTGSQIQAHQGGLRDLNRPQIDHPITGRRIDTQQMFDGTIVRTGENKEYKDPPMAGNTTNFTAIVQACLRAVGVRWCMPEYMISGDASNANYSSTLVSGSPFVNAVECEQDDFGLFFLRWRWVAIKNACEGGLIDAPFPEVQRLVDVHYTAPQVAVANKQEEAQIDQQDMQAGVMSKAERRRRRNLDSDLMKKEIEEEKAEGGGDQGGGGGPPGGGPDGGAPPPEAPPEGGEDESQYDVVGESIADQIRAQLDLIEAVGEQQQAAAAQKKKAAPAPGQPQQPAKPQPDKKKEGEVWKGPSGRYFTLKKGRVVPAPNPNKAAEAPKKRGVGGQGKAPTAAAKQAKTGRDLIGKNKGGVVADFGAGKVRTVASTKANPLSAGDRKALAAHHKEAAGRLREKGHEAEAKAHDAAAAHHEAGASKKPEKSKFPPDTKPRGLDDKRVEDLQEAGKVHQAALSDEEQDVVKYYTTGAYKAINATARGKSKPAGLAPSQEVDWDLAQGAIERLDAAFAKIPDLPKPQTVYRGMSLPKAQAAAMMAGFERSAKTGAPVSFGGYMSTTADPGIIEGFEGAQGGAGDAEPVRFEIAAKKGIYAEGMSEFARERELLLPNKAKFRVAGIKTVTFKRPSGASYQARIVQMEQL